ncbi:MAG TPA: 3-dehydroquinate synthase [Armatimonadota bacterium]|jgi:3-dehydroquinate synthase
MKLRPPARGVVLCGFMATGKSAVARALARRLGLQAVETDALIEQRAGKTIAEIFQQDGEQAFRDLESAAVAQVATQSGVVVSTGGGALLRPENVALLRQMGPLVCIQASAETIYQRARRNSRRPLLHGDDPQAAIARLLKEREPVYTQADFAVTSTEQGSPAGVAEEIVALLSGDSRTAGLTGQPLLVPVEVPGAAYPIHVGFGLLGRLGELVPPPRAGARAALISSVTLGGSYGEAARAGLWAAGWEPTLHLVPDGEQAKQMAVAERLCGELVEAGHDRGSWVFAVGGGVIGDLSGFVAALYMRGVSFVTVPTTLLAQVDASVGGKVAVNLPQGKNLVGAFHQPRAVVMDLETLATLPARQWAEGWAEIIKHAALADAEMFAYLEEHLAEIDLTQHAALQYVVGRNCQIKAEVVAQDPEERGWRAVLNFGHTVGHALERAATEWSLGHGEAVGLGMVAETRWAEAHGHTPAGTADRLAALLEKAGLPAAPTGLDLAAARPALKTDKKLLAGRLALPVLSGIGSVRLLPDVGLAEMEEALQWTAKR